MEYGSEELHGHSEAAAITNEVPIDSSRRALFTEAEIKAVREGINGVMGTLPARCYYDPDFFKFETQHVLKKNWLCVGRTDQVEKPGDYFTVEMFGEPLLIIRDRQDQINALVNVCQHRWAQVVRPGSGNTKLLVCPNHSWTYELDGRLRGVTTQDIPGFDKKNCRMPQLRVEVWKGFIFVNFDEDAQPLAPQLVGLNKYLDRLGLDQYVTADSYVYETDWNYKFSLENGYECYHVEGVHKKFFQGTALDYETIDYGENWGMYVLEKVANDFPFGRPPWLAEEEMGSFNDTMYFWAIYPSFIAVAQSYQMLVITTQFKGVDHSTAATSIHVPKWIKDRPGAEEKIATMCETMRTFQDEDTDGCGLLQRGVRSSYNKTGMVHPIEPQLSHYYNWLLDKYLS